MTSSIVGRPNLETAEGNLLIIGYSGPFWAISPIISGNFLNYFSFLNSFSIISQYFLDNFSLPNNFLIVSRLFLTSQNFSIFS